MGKKPTRLISLILNKYNKYTIKMIKLKTIEKILEGQMFKNDKLKRK